MHTVFNFSHAGGHTANEDAFLTFSHPDDESVLICALADGQGGRPGGAVAARHACSVVGEAARYYSPQQLMLTRTWVRIVREADSATYKLFEAGATTLVALCVTDHLVCGVSNGDSAAVLLNVHDQYHELTAKQIKNPPVGSGQALFKPFSMPLIEPWMVLLMSDGLWKYAGWNSVKTAMQRNKGQALLDRLITLAKSSDSGIFRDDTTMILVEGGS